MTSLYDGKVCADCKIVHDAEHPAMDCPQVLFSELLDEIEHSIAQQPRTLQTALGPSELGKPPCQLIRRFGGVAEPERSAGPDGYRAWVGTQMHNGFERIFKSHYRWSDTLQPTAQPIRRFLTESRVNVGTVNGVDIYGSNDLFDVESGTVWDWKTKGETRLLEARRDISAGRGPGRQYRVQQHLYGRGQQRAGHTVKRVGIVYTPRDGNLRDSFYWSEPYDESIAVDALTTATGLAQLVAAVGVEAAAAMYPECDDEFCPWCGPKRKAKALAENEAKRDKTATATTVRDLFSAAK